MNSILPPCSQKNLRNFLMSKNWVKSTDLSNKTHEVWIDAIGFNHVRFSKADDPIPFSAMIMIIEEQMNSKIYEVPFYAREIAQRISPD